MNDALPFAEIVQQALSAYDLDDQPRTFIQHSENVTYKVEQPNHGASLLRLHLPVQPSLDAPDTDARTVNSEMLWLQALNREVQLPVPLPLKNNHGEFVTQIKEANQVINCTLLQWLEGQAYEHEFETEDTAAQIGVLIGKLHLHTSRWRVPAGFRRPVRDRAYFEKSLVTLQLAAEQGFIRYQDFKTLETSIQILTDMLRALTKTRQTNGLLHGDLHRGNFIIDNGRIKLIDFSLCAIGNYMFDLGIGLADMAPDLRAVMLLNYDRLFRLPVEYKRLSEGFFIGSFVGTFASFFSDPNAQETLVRRVPLIAREYATRFNNDERFWFEQG